ncbi:hypothetical transmembrane protein [Photorhabdus asymbiotica]|nr:hypothetical transmembrane protein [Photorhabdus asymbiotica]CAR67233.1 hypothetical transmembrane protein [Photorhabdus asymbiotica subsp. asymbiotica ATCC 43949]
MIFFKIEKLVQSNTLLLGQNCNITVLLVLYSMFVIDIELYFIPVIFQVASLLAALTHPGHRVIYAPGDSLPGRRDAS